MATAKKKTPAVKATDELIDLAVRLVSARWLKSDIKRALAAAHAKTSGGGAVSVRTLETVISTALARIREQVDRPTTELRLDALAFYEGVIRNPEAAWRDRIRAQERVDQILGLNAPLKHEHSGAVATVPADLSKLNDAELAAYRAMLAKMSPPAAPPTQK